MVTYQKYSCRSLAFLSLLVLLLCGAAQCGKFIKFEYSGRNNMLYIPTNLTQGAPFIVMLHGCMQTALDFAEGTRMVLAYFYPN